MNAPKIHLDARQAREAFHLILLQELGERLLPELWAVKGGVNLRIFFQSVRYSEDIDLDVVPLKRLAVRKHLREILKSETFLRKLRKVGIQQLLAGEKEISKDSETTLRFGRSVVVGGVPHSTTIEVFFRAPHEKDQTEFAPVDPRFSEAYLEPDTAVQVPHYVRLSALAQKLDALANRAAVQPRDVFDICWLIRSALTSDERDWLARRVGRATLRKAAERAAEIHYEDYRGKVIDYLDPADAAAFSGEDAWLKQQVRVVDLADELFTRTDVGDTTPSAEPGV